MSLHHSVLDKRHLGRQSRRSMAQFHCVVIVRIHGRRKYPADALAYRSSPWEFDAVVGQFERRAINGNSCRPTCEAVCIRRPSFMYPNRLSPNMMLGPAPSSVVVAGVGAGWCCFGCSRCKTRRLRSTTNQYREDQLALERSDKEPFLPDWMDAKVRAWPPSEGWGGPVWRDTAGRRKRLKAEPLVSWAAGWAGARPAASATMWIVSAGVLGTASRALGGP